MRPPWPRQAAKLRQMAATCHRFGHAHPELTWRWQLDRQVKNSCAAYFNQPHVFPAHSEHMVTCSQCYESRKISWQGSVGGICHQQLVATGDFASFQVASSWVSVPFSRRHNKVRQAAHSSGDRLPERMRPAAVCALLRPAAATAASDEYTKSYSRAAVPTCASRY